MATYFQNLSNQNLLTPYPGDEKLASYSEPPGNMMMYLNQASYNGSYSEVLPDGGRNEMMFIPPTSDQVRDCIDHGLSLSLSTQIPAGSMPSFQYQYPNPNEYNQSEQFRNFDSLASGLYGGGHETVKTQGFGNPMCSVGSKEMHSEAYLYDSLGSANAMSNSKYLKAAQQLLDEVVNVREALKQSGLNKQQSLKRNGLDGSKDNDGNDLRKSSDPSEASTMSSVELSPAERQDLQNKKTKLLSMLDEVDRRYKQYYHQMQVVVSFFDKVAGNRAAVTYTALALQAISSHFRSLRDAIKGQIQVTRRSLGEQDSSSDGQGGVIPRLRYVDQQLRQQRAFQQLGGMQHAWRPQRGLPENSVSILRAWLFEHFLLPYPKDSEKVMLARQTGLTRNQVANWFINARVRLWKPMIEEMYKEEFGDLDMDAKSSPENALKEEARVDFSASEDRKEELHEGLISATADSVQQGRVHAPNSGHKPNQSSVSTYDMLGLDHFTVGNEVSLALNLRHSEEHEGAASLDCHYEDPEQQQLIQVWEYPPVT